MCQKLNQNSIGQILSQHLFNNEEPMTLKQIAEIEGVSHQYVAEVLARALVKFKKAFDDRGIKFEDLV
jgi:DNA-directed RNA polymerase sigma subunit (sigma70/sigma32)